MKKINLFLYLIMSFGLTFCSDKGNVIQTEQVIDLELEVGHKRNLSDFLSLNRYIPLETTDESIIGIINKVIIKDSLIFILDKDYLQKLLVFDIKGNYIHQISKKGNGPGEYQYISDFTIHDGMIILLNNRTHKMTYDFNGHFIDSEELPFWADVIIPFSNYTKGLITNSDLNVSQRHLFNILNKNNSNVKGYLNSRFLNIPIRPFQQTTTRNDTTYFFIPFEPYVFYSDGEALYEKYKIKYPSDCIISSNKIQEYKNKPIPERFNILSETVYISSIIFSDSLEIFQYSNKDIDYLLFKKQTEIFIIQESNIENDLDGIPLIPYLYSNYDSDKIIACYFQYQLDEISKTDLFINSPLKSIEIGQNLNPIIAIYNSYPINEVEIVQY